ncbi:AAA family ATPase [Streptomyces sp. G7(2002)]|uniref:AAA family ATPase n=1 Tax=Streptomyces sp. G7(2002) TaxID=2971798 RepID=UPI00237D9776|nr:AAA family ATPase [Streptomyces sp. G7(2002)]WDT56496.1 ATP-binding protein [Streptomyces sp. G7(2002)]
MPHADHLHQLTSILEAVDHSAPSVSKYRELQLLLAQHTDLDPQLIYPTYASKAGNISVRSGQSKRAKDAKLMVFVVKRADQDEAIQRAAREFANHERKPVLILQQDAAQPAWRPAYGLIPVGDQFAFQTMSHLREAFGPFKVDRHPKTADSEGSRPTNSERTDPLPFVVLPDRNSPFETVGESLVLIPDSWDDYGFKTLYDLYYQNNLGIFEEIGQVKIAHASQEHGRTPLPERFTKLNREFFSLGQDATYYDRLKDRRIREVTLSSLRDVAYYDSLDSAVIENEVSRKSLFRHVDSSTVDTQFRRIAHGGVKLRDFVFQYASPNSDPQSNPLELRFEVLAESEPSTNIHVVIGGNGVGKTTLLRGMSRALASPAGVRREDAGTFTDLEADWEPGRDPFPFFNVIFVSFSAFDSFSAMVSNAEPEPDTLFDTGSPRVPLAYIGLGSSEEEGHLRDTRNLGTTFVNSVGECLARKSLRGKWIRAVQALEVDPLFRDLQISTTVSVAKDGADEDLSWSLADELMDLFNNRASSGHKIVLLTLAQLIRNVRERSLVLFDEPESHLHPPLLAAYMRALSDLLAETNGAAIIATHSPVVLQEVPRSCVWKLRRSGNESVVERPQIETFGENVGVLTHEVFGLEVTQSGYHAELQRAVAAEDSFEAVASRLGNQLGSEAQGIVRILMAVKAAGGSKQ